MVAAIKSNLPSFQKVSPKPLWKAQDLGTVMVKLGLHPPVRRHDFVGDLLGGHCCRLPWVLIDGVRHYDLGCLNATQKDKERRIQELAAMTAEALVELKTTINDIDIIIVND